MAQLGVRVALILSVLLLCQGAHGAQTEGVSVQAEYAAMQANARARDNWSSQRAPAAVKPHGEAAPSPPNVQAAPQHAQPAQPQPAPPPAQAAPLPAGAPETDQLRPLNVVRSAPDELGQVPDHYFWLRPGLQAAQDPLDNDIVFFNDEGRITGRATLPAGFAIADVVATTSAVRLTDKSGRRQISIARNIDAAAIRSLQPLPITPDTGGRAGLLTRQSRDLLVLNDEVERGGKPLDVRSLTGGLLAQAYDVGSGPNNTRYVVSEEVVAAAPQLQVRVIVRRYDADGNLSGIVYVPLDDLDVVPHDFIAITDKGLVRALASTANGVTIREYEFGDPSRLQRPLRLRELTGLGRALREIAVDSKVDRVRLTPFHSGGPRFAVKVATPPIAREAVLRNARAFLAINWTMQSENYARRGIDNACEPSQGRFWLRPHHFTSDLVGATIGPMPYRWGGEDTPQSYHVRIEAGALAGNICTCRSPALNYCLFADSAGTDCSGFVSRAWGIEKRGTSGLLDVADEVKRLADLKPGDAFDWPQHHVRLFTGLAPGGATAFTVLESTTRYPCEGVCEATYRPSELNGYRLIRYRGITD
ncbi:MAG TPA: hypothetical protein VFA57_14945 [Pseudolabrys sp.]|nr:hypothetical protein [Pseudolabrys sp.]